MEHENYVSLETAKLLKQTGFDWGCHGFYGIDVRHNGESIDFDEECELKAEGKESEIEYVDGGKVYSFYHSNIEDGDYGGYSRPTLAVAQKWLREVKGMYIYVKPCNIYNEQIESWSSRLFYKGNDIIVQGGAFGSYEEALEAGIKECVEEKMFVCGPECSEE